MKNKLILLRLLIFLTTYLAWFNIYADNLLDYTELNPLVENIIQKADSLSESRKYEESNRYYYNAINLLKKKKKWKNIFLLTIKISNNLSKLSKLDECLFLLKKNLDLSISKFELNNEITALIIHRIGVTYYRMDKPHIALKYYTKALKIRNAIISAPHPDLAKSLHNIGQTYSTIGKLDSAIIFFSNSLKIHPNPPYDFIGVTLRLLGDNLIETGDSKKAESNLLLSLRLHEENNKEAPWALAEFYLSEITNFYLKIRQFDKVIYYCNKALSIYNNLEEKYPEDYIEMANAFINLGLSYKNKNELRLAIQYFEEAKNIGNKYWENNSSNYALLYTNMGNSYRRLGNYTMAKYSPIPSKEF